MEAHPGQPLRAALIRWAFAAAILASGSCGWAATARSTNFVVHAPTPALAQEIAGSAERWRKELAVEWLGQEMPAWGKPCPIHCSVSPRLGAGGETSFIFDGGHVFGWKMRVQGSRERVLDSVLPHEITHTVFATHFRRPLPRWADEGACTTVEHPSEIGKQERMLIRFLKTGQGIPFHRMFALKEYPANVMPLYSQGHSVTTFLIERRGKKEFLEFLANGMAEERWEEAIREHYGHANLRELQDQWMQWVVSGRPKIALEPDVATIASATPPPNRGASVLPPVDSRGSVYAAMAQAPRTPSPRAQAPIVRREPIQDASRPTSTYLR